MSVKNINQIFVSWMKKSFKIGSAFKGKNFAGGANSLFYKLIPVRGGEVTMIVFLSINSTHSH